MTARRLILAALSLAAPALLGPAPAAAQTVPPAAQPTSTDRLLGEIGVAVYARTEGVRDTGTSTLVLPYVYADWGRFFARVDTLGARLVPLGRGHLELVARISTEGWDADRPSLRGLSDRDNPLPVGLGTVQRTAYGALFLYAMHDLRSGGNYLEATWGSRFDLGRIALYPLLGLEYRTRGYVRHLYGVDAAQSAASGYAAYSPGASTVPMVGLAATVPIAGPWALQLQWRHRWLDDAIRNSPIVDTGAIDSGHVALTYEFE